MIIGCKCISFLLNCQILRDLFYDVVKDTGDFIFYELMVHGLTDDFVGNVRGYGEVGWGDTRK